MAVTPNSQSIVNVIDEKTSSVSKKARDGISEWCTSTWKPVLAEFVATTLLVYIGCMTTVPLDGIPFQQPMYSPLGFGLVVMFNVQIFGHLSGAHMNPAVSLAAVVFGKLSIATGVAYALAQVVGAIFGYAILLYIISPMELASGVCVTQIHPILNVWQGLVVETILTSALNFMNCSVWDPVNKDKADSVPIKFGLAIAGLSLAGGPLTGASMNPARSLGPALLTGVWTDFWVYCVGPLLAGILPTVLYKYIWLKQTSTSKSDVTTSS